jgi:prepilin-type N-terminal cleavage/methylation domain-containing protein
MRRADRRGVALLEVLAALAILGIAGSGLTAFAIESAGAVGRARAEDDRMRAASAFLDKVALWERDDLDRHLGDHRQGDWRLGIARPSATLYVVRLADSSGARTLLSTALYRRESYGALEDQNVRR